MTRSIARSLQRLRRRLLSSHLACRTTLRRGSLLSIEGLAACLVVSSASFVEAQSALTANVVRRHAPPTYVVTDLGTIPGSNLCPCFFGISISNGGHVVGRFFGDNGRYHGFLWQDGAMIDIGSLGGDVTQVLSVNQWGVAVGL